MSRRFLKYSLLFSCALAPALSLYCLLGLFVDYFFWDEWNLLVRFSTYIFYRNPYAWNILWEPHFSHRLVLLKLLSTASFHVFGGNQLPLLLLAWLVQVGLLIVLVTGKHMRPVPSTLFAGGSVFLSLLLFSPAMTLAWVWPVCLQQLLTTLFFCWAMIRVGHIGQGSNWIMTSFLAVLCTYSSGNGVIVWPACVLLGVMIRIPAKQLILLATVGGLTLLTYFHDLPVERVGTGGDASLQDKIAYVLAFLGSPLSRGNLGAAIACGAIGLVLYCILCLVAFRQHRVEPIIALSLAWLSIGSACAGAGYRIGDGGIEQALVDRYVPLIMPFWASILLACLCMSSFPRFRVVTLAGVGTLSLLSYLPLLGPGPIDPKAFRGSSHSFVRVAHEALRERVLVTSDTNPYVNLFPSPIGVLDGLADMRQHAIGPFRHTPWYTTRLGTALGDFGPVCDDCGPAGSLDAVEAPFGDIDPCREGYEKGAIARGILKVHSNRVREILLVNAQDQVVGVGFPIGQFRFGQDPTTIIWSEERHWIGFVSGGHLPQELDQRKVSGFARLERGSRLAPLVGEIHVGADLTACNS
ncbi:hypothetical protein BH23PLA1_BH23PLA1_24170 [soil metagenome]